jgi:hypothetical protein
MRGVFGEGGLGISGMAGGFQVLGEDGVRAVAIAEGGALFEDGSGVVQAAGYHFR